MHLHDRGVAPFHRASRAVGAGAAIEAARASGVLDALGDGAAASALAADLGLDERAAVLLLEALVDIGVVTRRDERYTLAMAADVIATLTDLWAALPQFLATGQPHRRMDEPEQADAAYGPVASALGDVRPDFVEQVTTAIGDPGRRMLDLGAGTAPWSRALAARHQHVSVTAVELSTVAVLTDAAIASSGLAGRLRVVAGDLFTAAVDAPFDTVLVANVCRLFGEDDVRRLLTRAAALAAPGGRIVIIDVLPDRDRPGEESIGLYALGLALRTASGGVHPFSAYAAWLYDAGFVHIEVEPLGQPELSMIRANRPG